MEESLELYRKNKIFYYRPDIDGLRAIAVLFVIVFHTFPTLLAGGFIGVDIFFVVSGFLISGIILEALHNNSFSYVNFYARRIRRIFPALIVVLASCLVAGWFVFFSGEYFNLAKETIYGAGFLSNIGYWLESGYFDISSSLKPLVHLWSLGIEEQFYLVWPVLLVFLYKRTKKIPLSILIFLALSFFLDYTITLKNPTTAFYMPFCRFWELMAGAFLSYVTLFKGGLIKNITDKFKITFSEKKNILILEALSCVGILSIFIPAFVIKSKEIYIGWILLAVIGVFLLIASGANTFINKYILSNRVLVGIGLISYPLYLWHWPLLAFARIINGDVVSVNVRIVLIITSFILAWLTYLFIEKPIRHSKKKIVPIILFSIIIVIAIMGIAICKNNGFNFRFPMQEKTLKEVSLVARKNIPPVYKNGICKEYQDIVSAKTENGLRCEVYGSGEKDIFVVGDSHSTVIFEGYKESLSKKGYKVIRLNLPGCPVILPGSKDPCTSAFEKIAGIIKSDKNSSGVIASNNAWGKSVTDYKKIMDETISNLPKNIPIIWFLQTPRIPFDLTKCINRPLFSQNYLSSCSFPISYYSKITIGYEKVIEEIIKSYPNVITIDPAKVLCNSKECFATLDGKFLYRDNNHLSSFGANYLSGKFPITQYFSYNLGIR